MNSKSKGVMGVILGILGVAFILLFDIIVGKPYMIGYKSIIGFVVCAVVIVMGVRWITKGSEA